jgi:hypothetical protein
MKQYKYLFGINYYRFSVRVALILFPFAYAGHEWLVTWQRKIFKKKLDEREYETKLKFQEFTESFSFKENAILKEFKTEQEIDFKTFQNQNEYLIVFYGSIEFYMQLFKEFEEVTLKSIKNAKFLYILESEAAKKTLVQVSSLLKENMIIGFLPENERKNVNINANNIYVISPENKLLYSKKIAREYATNQTYFNRVLKDINLKIRKEAENKFIKSFQF